MANRYLVIKQHLNEYLHKAFGTVEASQQAVNPSEAFPGDYVTVYDLQENKYLHMDQFPGIDGNALQQIVNLYK